MTGFTITSKITLDEVYPKSKKGKVLKDIEEVFSASQSKQIRHIIGA